MSWTLEFTGRQSFVWHGNKTPVRIRRGSIGRLLRDGPRLEDELLYERGPDKSQRSEKVGLSAVVQAQPGRACPAARAAPRRGEAPAGGSAPNTKTAFTSPPGSCAMHLPDPPHTPPHPLIHIYILSNTGRTGGSGPGASGLRRIYSNHSSPFFRSGIEDPRVAELEDPPEEPTVEILPDKRSDSEINESLRHIN
ncbi:unnamed protein product [Pleuronectes platessa]|uniref:Uncharacterized protein n=1 Tax=Pleuronectes platessa TaxID=8262 RepID=A0A9N7U0E8_PLEPL|nr:unnamed protein product [Pleuronectes platessa]